MKLIITIIICTLLIIAVVTNPNQENHQAKVKSLFMSSISKELSDFSGENSWDTAGKTIGLTLGMNMIDNIITSFITADNYVLCSFTRASFDGKSRIIGVGAFGNVWIDPEIMSSVKELQQTKF
jgi:hypothetical protein